MRLRETDSRLLRAIDEALGRIGTQRLRAVSDLYEANLRRPAGRRALVALVPELQGTTAGLKTRISASGLKFSRRETGG
jgi:hypothetical protein